MNITVEKIKLLIIPIGISEWKVQGAQDKTSSPLIVKRKAFRKAITFEDVNGGLMTTLNRKWLHCNGQFTWQSSVYRSVCICFMSGCDCENQAVQSCSMQHTELHEPSSACLHCAVLCSFCSSTDLLHGQCLSHFQSSVMPRCKPSKRCLLCWVCTEPQTLPGTKSYILAHKCIAPCVKQPLYLVKVQLHMQLGLFPASSATSCTHRVSGEVYS